jgi:hypothetical protein
MPIRAPIRRVIVPIRHVHAGFCERLRFHLIDIGLREGWNVEHARSVGGISESEARSAVAFARMQGWLPKE